MKVTISEVIDIRDALMASGLSLWLEGMGVSVDAPPMPVLTMQPVVVASSPIAAAPPVKKSAPLSPKPGTGAERITIRQRILNAMRDRPMGSADVVRLLKTDGINASIGNAGQHMYLLTHDGFAVRNEGSGTWSITEAGRNR
jgi:hypothetical protein